MLVTIIRETAPQPRQRDGRRFRTIQNRIDAECEQDFVGASGIFAKVLTQCKIDTFSSCLTYTPETGYRVWFTLYLSYQHFNGGSNGMNIASFWFENGEWTMSDYKEENEED